MPLIRYRKCADPQLSILICHLPERETLLQNLVMELVQQINEGPVEIWIDNTIPEIQTIGAKRNVLMDVATGRYLAFIDDDDTVTGNYVRLILNAIREGNDCIGIVGILKRQGKPDWQFRHSITVGRWCKDKQKRIYFRTPNHLNPVKSELAKQVMFPEMNYGEDKSYSDKLRPLLTTETFIETPIYIYQK